MDETPKSRKPNPWPMALVGIVLLVVLLTAFSIHSCNRRVERSVDLGEKLAASLRNAFLEIANVDPVIQVNEQVFFQKEQALLELVVISREEMVERETTHEYFKSTKSYRVRGRYQVKAGFNLADPVAVEVQPESSGNDEILITLPPPRILSVEQLKFEVLESKDGIWNKVSPDDIEEVVNTLQKQARQHAEASPLPGEAVHLLKSQLEERLGRSVTIKTSTPTPPPLQ